jgi:transcriptional regulator with XRE-family HTH domain
MRDLSNFSETLTELMSERNLVSHALGKELGVGGTTIWQWKDNRNKLGLKNALKLADYFECSLEYLMGRKSERLEYIPQGCPPFYDNLLKVMKENNKTIYRVILDTRFSQGSFSRWKNGTDPLMDSVTALADYLGCTADYLVGREN